MSLLGKRKRGTSHAVSAFAARRKAHETAAGSPSPAAKHAEGSVVVVVEDASDDSSESTDVHGTDVLEDVSNADGDLPPGRYFEEGTSSPVLQAETVHHPEPPAPLRQGSAAEEHAARRAYRIDPACTSSWQPRPSETVSNDGEVMTITLERDEHLILRGVATLLVKVGRVSVSGAILESSTSMPIFAPATHPLPVIRNEGSSTATLQLGPLRTGIEGISRVVEVAGLASRAKQMWTDPNQAYTHSGAGFDIVMEARPQLFAAREPPSWTSALDVLTRESTAEPLRIAVLGLPRTGKSTFARTLLNRLFGSHSHVYWLDCDLGQSEFTPPGSVALVEVAQPAVGPSFVHCCRPAEKLHYLGSYEARTDPRYYLDCISDLIHTFRSQYSDSPLIVNMPGWSKGLVADLQSSIISALGPTHIVNVGSQEGLSYTETQSKERKRLSVEAVGIEASDFLRMNGASKRQLSLMSYLYCSRISRESVTRWDFSAPLLAQRPFEVSFNSIEALQILLPEAPPEREVLNLLNGSLVALAEPTESSESSMRYLTDTPNPSMYTVLGLAIVRGIDMASNTLHLLTPVASDTACRARVLVRGAAELPTVALIDPLADASSSNGVAGVDWKDVPFLAAPSISSALGSGPRRVRRNVMRKGLTSSA